MDENEITQRLREAGNRPVPGGVRSTHLTRMQAAVPVVEKQKRFGRLAVAAAAFVGFAVGSTGFAMAGALPDPAQAVAHDVLSVVQVQVPDRPDNRGQCISAAARANPNDAAAKQLAKDQCPKGKPSHAGKGKAKGRPDHAGTPGGPNGIPHDADPCKGPPPWAGKGAKDLTPEDKQRMREQRAADCGRDLDDATEDEVDVLEDQQSEADGPDAQGPPEGKPAPLVPAGPPADGPAPDAPTPDDPDPEAG